MSTRPSDDPIAATGGAQGEEGRSHMDLLSAFKVPEAAIPVIDRILSPEDALLIEALPSATFGGQDARSALEVSTGETWPDTRLDPLLRGAYRRGVLDLEDETFTRFRLGDFYTMLEVFVDTEPEAYLALPRETQVALDRWCFESYCEGLGDDVRPTSDRVAGLDETLGFIDTIDRPIWLNRCDCRTLAGSCDKPVDTCISFRNGINTLSHRGILKPITKEQAKAVVRGANDAGLMQTISDNAICNCCSDCCYLFRAQAARASGAAWPLAESIAAVGPDLCIGCGVCVSRCPFGALALEDGEAVRNAGLCRGCGLCAETCPTSAIAMLPRDDTRRPVK